MYTLKNMWRVCVFLCLLWPFRSVAEKQWCAVTDHNHIVLLTNINYLASTPGESKFYIVLKDGTAIEEVESISFARFHIDGLEDVELGTTTELAFTAAQILISNAPMGAPVTVSTLEGRNMILSKIQSESHQLDISSLASGIYVLSVNGKSVKFRKI